MITSTLVILGVRRVRPPRVLRVLARIIADLDGLARYPPIATVGRSGGKDAEDRRASHWRGLVEPSPTAEEVECPGKKGGLVARPGSSASQAKEVSPAGEWIGTRLSPSRGGLEKVP